jgi:hypothetical protein
LFEDSYCTIVFGISGTVRYVIGNFVSPKIGKFKELFSEGLNKSKISYKIGYTLGLYQQIVSKYLSMSEDKLYFKP